MVKIPGITERFKSKTWLCAMLALISFVVYANTLNNDFVLDDVTVITRNINVTQGVKGIPALLTSPRLKGYQTTRDQESYRPIPMITHALEYEAFGANATAGHFFNIIFFACCVIALFLFLSKLFPDKLRAVFVASVLFAVHPIHTEVVANIKSRDELLCFLFGFLSLNAFSDYVKKNNLSRLLAGSLLLLLAYLSKETIISFIFIIPLVFFGYLNDNRKSTIWICTATAIVTICFLALRAAILPPNHTNAVIFLSNPLVSASVTSRLATAILVLGYYLRLLVIPYPLICDYSYNTIPIAGFGNIYVLLSLAIYLFLLATAIYRFTKIKKDPWALGILFSLSTLALFSNIVMLVYSEMAERFVFFASAGFCLCIALLYQQIIGIASSQVKKNITTGLLITVCILFSILTIQRNTDWKDNMTLFSTDMDKAPGNCELIYFAGNELQNPERDNTESQQVKDQQSISLFYRALMIYPDFCAAHTSLGGIYERQQMFDSAIVHDSIALALIPTNSIASLSLASSYAGKKKYLEAIKYFRNTVSLEPRFVPAYLQLAKCYTADKQYDSAIVYFSETLSMAPGQEEAQQGLAYARAMKAAK